MTMRVKRRRGYTRVSRKNQVTIPASVLRELGLGPGDTLQVASGDGAIVLRPDSPPDAARRRLQVIDELSGSLTGMYEPGYLSRLRAEWP